METDNRNERAFNDVVTQTKVDIVYDSPGTCHPYQSTVALPKDTPGISDVEDGTSENSRRVRQEVVELYEEIFSTPAISNTQEEVNEDRETYKKELKRMKRQDDGR